MLTMIFKCSHISHLQHRLGVWDMGHHWDAALECQCLFPCPAAWTHSRPRDTLRDCWWRQTLKKALECSSDCGGYFYIKQGPRWTITTLCCPSTCSHTGRGLIRSPGGSKVVASYQKEHVLRGLKNGHHTQCVFALSIHCSACLNAQRSRLERHATDTHRDALVTENSFTSTILGQSSETIRPAAAASARMNSHADCRSRPQALGTPITIYIVRRVTKADVQADEALLGRTRALHPGVYYVGMVYIVTYACICPLD